MTKKTIMLNINQWPRFSTHWEDAIRMQHSGRGRSVLPIFWRWRWPDRGACSHWYPWPPLQRYMLPPSWRGPQSPISSAVTGTLSKGRRRTAVWPPRYGCDMWCWSEGQHRLPGNRSTGTIAGWHLSNTRTGVWIYLEISIPFHRPSF